MEDIDRTYSVLVDVPVFCFGRFYEAEERDRAIRKRYTFKFDNGYGASVVQFYNKELSSGAPYELALMGLTKSGVWILIANDELLDSEFCFRSDDIGISNQLRKIENHGQEFHRILSET